MKNSKESNPLGIIDLESRGRLMKRNNELLTPLLEKLTEVLHTVVIDSVVEREITEGLKTGNKVQFDTIFVKRPQLIRRDNALLKEVFALPIIRKVRFHAG